MIAEKILSAYIDANIILIAVATIWFIAKSAISHTRWRVAYLSQLNLLYAVLVTVALSPLIVLAVGVFQRLGLGTLGTGYTVSDFLVAQYLDGKIAMTPTRFEHLLMMRTELTHQIASGKGALGLAVLTTLALGFITTLIRNARNFARVAKTIRGSYILRRIHGIDIRITHNATVPFSTRGFRRHYIVLPSSLLAQADDVRIAVSHEIQHIRQSDLTWEIALEICRPLFFWNPAFVYCKREVERMRELACDQQVLGRGVHAIRDYCECLLRVCKTSVTGNRVNQIITPSVPFARVDDHRGASHSIAFLKLRVTSMLDGSAGVSGRRHAPLLVIPLVAAIAFLAVTTKPANDWSQDRLMLSAIVNLERLNSR